MTAIEYMPGVTFNVRSGKELALAVNTIRERTQKIRRGANSFDDVAANTLQGLIGTQRAALKAKTPEAKRRAFDLHYALRVGLSAYLTELGINTGALIGELTREDGAAPELKELDQKDDYPHARYGYDLAKGLYLGEIVVSPVNHREGVMIPRSLFNGYLPTERRA